jgi:hypothetical protein
MKLIIGSALLAVAASVTGNGTMTGNGTNVKNDPSCKCIPNMGVTDAW